MRIDDNGKLLSDEYERKISYEEKIEHRHREVMRTLKPYLRTEPLYYEQFLRSFENHDIIRANFRLYALTRNTSHLDSREILCEISELQHYIGRFEIDQLDWDDKPRTSSYDEDDLDYEDDEMTEE